MLPVLTKTVVLLEIAANSHSEPLADKVGFVSEESRSLIIKGIKTRSFTAFRMTFTNPYRSPSPNYTNVQSWASLKSRVRES
ncbi:hypothetical protein BMS3Bbin04_00795 [bacterium BMS3Bbin04]|nr:hypothetical protein BMS3Bbin04_00795 [bacterium BMS3Bbin04]